MRPIARWGWGAAIALFTVACAGPIRDGAPDPLQDQGIDGGGAKDAGGVTSPAQDSGSGGGGATDDAGTGVDAGQPGPGPGPGPGPVDGGTLGGFQFGPTNCQAVGLDAGVSVGGYVSDRFAWSDEGCQRRIAALVRNNAADPGGSRGGFLRELTWTAGGATRTARGTGNSGWNGWGYIVNHYGSTADHSQKRTGTFSTLLAGAHHAIHEYKLRMSPGGPMDVTVHWFFATGRSAPVYAISYDLTPTSPNVVQADTRAPYGDLTFEGSSTEIGGIGWGDKFKFTTTGAGPVTTSTPWDYTAPNTVPYVRMWSKTVDAEMGAVQTQSFDQHVAGGDYGVGTLGAHCWGKTSQTKGASCSNSGQVMPADWLWPYQLNQYELPFTTSSHRFAWGATYGAVGQSSVSAFGKTISGYPRTSYSVLMVVGPHSTNATMAEVTQVERMLGAALTASEGTVATQGPAGVGRPDNMTYSPAGLNPVYATWDVTAVGNRATFTLDPRGGALSSPIFRIRSFTASQVSSVTMNGNALTAGTQYFATVDPISQVLWITLNGDATGPVTLHVE